MLERLHTHLAVLRREGRIDTWYDREILAGGNLNQEINDQLETSELFLLLVSPDFLASNYCYEREMTVALERHRVGAAQVVPIIIEPCDWESTPLRELKALPRDGKPVSEWTNSNNAFLDVVQELRRLVNDEAPQLIVLEGNQPIEDRPEVRRYRVKRDFDDIDRSDFREAAFNAIRNYFEASINEIDAIDNLRGRYAATGPFTFTCTIINRGRDRGVAHITVHGRNGDFGLADIYYSFSENAPPNSAHGGFTIEADEFDLFLRPSMSVFEQGGDKLSPQAAATKLWVQFLERAGVAYE